MWGFEKEILQEKEGQVSPFETRVPKRRSGRGGYLMVAERVVQGQSMARAERCGGGGRRRGLGLRRGKGAALVKLDIIHSQFTFVRGARIGRRRRGGNLLAFARGLGLGIDLVATCHRTPKIIQLLFESPSLVQQSSHKNHSTFQELKLKLALRTGWRTVLLTRVCLALGNQLSENSLRRASRALLEPGFGLRPRLAFGGGSTTGIGVTGAMGRYCDGVGADADALGGRDLTSSLADMGQARRGGVRRVTAHARAF
ncbi:hypothetical protein AG1IA_09481 [Rhizoctonia solani AG-1 IA]|uniref:Uncharacterized protein n=1 Tax=Thanatephorus cucumeris (strain AG1-IA) TaxID=983506 RepID=L8WE75_THACA|nr:hypothetical protein AG1IA_09481 [Rhizoctonia solani AG-1 IA]